MSKDVSLEPINTSEANDIRIRKVPFRCVVCKGFGRVNYGKKICHACKGKGYLLVVQE